MSWDTKASWKHHQMNQIWELLGAAGWPAGDLGKAYECLRQQWSTRKWTNVSLRGQKFFCAPWGSVFQPLFIVSIVTENVFVWLQFLKRIKNVLYTTHWLHGRMCLWIWALLMWLFSDCQVCLQCCPKWTLGKEFFRGNYWKDVFRRD